jgi:hypothetical protein
LVSHKKTSGAISKRSFWFKGQNKKVKVKAVSMRRMLYKDSLYGKRTPPMMTESNHIRRPSSSLTVVSQIDKIVDPVIGTLAQKCIGEIKNKKGLLPPGFV